MTPDLWAFLLASVGLTLAPGPDNLLVLTLGMSRGKREALWTALGMCSGISLHTLAVAVGLAGVLTQSALVFGLLQGAGALYLLYLAWQAFTRPVLLKKSPLIGLPTQAGKLFFKGVALNALNPKVALFFLAFLPQFVPADAPHPLQSLLWLGLLFFAQALLLFGSLALVSGSLGEKLLQHPRWSQGLNWFSGVVLGALGLRLALLNP